MCTLGKFPPLPQPGHLTVCEVEGKSQSLPIDSLNNVDMFTNAIALHPRINVQQELGASSIPRSDASRVFVPVGDTFLKQVVTTWQETGLLSAITIACRERQGHLHGLLGRSALFILSLMEFLSRIRDKFHPHLREKGEGLTNLVSRCREWSLSPIRCLDWHPHSTKLAVAAFNDSVRVYSADSNLVPILKSQSQTAVSCLAWRPFSAAELAVGCQAGVILWTVDPASVVARPSISCADMLCRPGHTPVTGLAWAPQGDLLVTVSAADNTMYVWDPEQDRSTPLRRVGGGGVCLAEWSPVGERLFAATAGVVFRVWSTKTWTPERWNTPQGRVRAACWSPCGSVLLFVTTSEPLVYALPFDAAGSAFGNNDVREARAVIDLAHVEISKEGERAGGIVSCMLWDRRGLHLALIFQDSPVVAIFRTQVGISVMVSPCCFVNGLPGEHPSTIAFQKNFEEGSLLTIAWSSGRLQYFPIICSDLDSSSASVKQARTLSSSSLNKSGYRSFM